ncbi:SAF domain-containing protein [Nocardioides sp. TF02-7]|uniref:SAF domain-containing protein n=1 Tax=Nocardioides sp. TF02-7 TaxID=2917724 RepID=UPI001F050EC3|nr:SAF domain-containing protein [Nocardioides sp. TF02-7]UMG93304.1 SAF domain-containing protein [Nocardioides sp. TF02-7]
MSTDISGNLADRQRSRAARAAGGPAGRQQVSPPRQRRPALAALALLLIVGGALVAGLLAVRMDSRVPVLVAARDIEAGAEITADDLEVAQVASEGLDLIGEEYADQVVGAYAASSISANTLLDERMVTTEDPIDAEKAVVSVPLDPSRSAAGKVRPGDLVQLWRASKTTGAGSKPQFIGTAYVLSIERAEDEEFVSDRVSSAYLLVPAEVSGDVIAAASAGEAGVAIVASGQDPDVELEVGE